MIFPGKARKICILVFATMCAERLPRYLVNVYKAVYVTLVNPKHFRVVSCGVPETFSDVKGPIIRCPRYFYRIVNLRIVIPRRNLDAFNFYPPILILNPECRAAVWGIDANIPVFIGEFDVFRRKVNSTTRPPAWRAPWGTVNHIAYSQMTEDYKCENR